MEPNQKFKMENNIFSIDLLKSSKQRLEIELKRVTEFKEKLIA